MGFISQQGLINLANWKYEGAPYTPVELLLNPFWVWFASLIPHSIAPNMVSLSGLIVTTIAVVAVLVNDPTLEGEIPNYLYFYGAFATFMFQTLDAADGKHARTTNQSSPLGQLFDHGCDAINLYLSMFLYVQALGYGFSNLPTLYTCIMGTSLFFSSQWEEWHSRVCKHALFGIFGVTETQLFSCAFILTGALGRPFYGVTLGDVFGAESFKHMPLCYDGTPMADSHITSWYQAISGSGATMGILIQFFYLVPTSTKFTPIISAYLGFIPNLMYWGTVYCTFFCTNWAMQNSGLAFLLIMPSHVLNSSKQITCNFTREEMSWFPKTPLWFLLFPINKYCGMPIAEGYIAGFIFAMTSISYLNFAIVTINQITEHLGICCLIPTKHPLPPNKVGVQGESKVEGIESNKHVEGIALMKTTRAE